MNRIIFVCFLFFSSSLSFGQGKATLQGYITDSEGKPLEKALIMVDKQSEQTYSDADGKYKLTIPAQTDIEVRFQYLSFSTTVRLNAAPNEKIEKNITIKAFVLEPVDVLGKHDDGYIRLDPRHNYKIPTPRGGIESYLLTVGGVFNTNELSSQYNVRGGNFDENLIYVNDIEIYRPFLMRNAQQEGMSFVNLDLTSGVKFSAGGFEAKYGDKMSSVMDVEYKKPKKHAGGFMVSMLGASAYAEGSVKNKFSYLIGARYRSNAYLIKSMDTKGEFKPRFFDTQFLLGWIPIPKLEISLLGNVSNNNYFQRPQDKETPYGAINSTEKLYVYYEGEELDKYETYLGGLTFNYKMNQKNNIRLILSSYYAKESETYDILGEYYIKETEADLGSGKDTYVTEGATVGVGRFRNHARNYMTVLVSAADLRGGHHLKRNRLEWGVKVQNENIKDKIKEWGFIDSSGHVLPVLDTTTPGEPVPLDDISRVFWFDKNLSLRCANHLNTARISAFIQDTWNIDGDSLTRFKLNAGLRFNYWTYNHETTFSPRINFSYKPRWKRDWIFFLRTGIYYQPPFYKEIRNPQGELNPNIKAQRSWQAVAASEYSFRLWNRPFKFTTEVYYKYLDRMISYTVDNVKITYSGLNDSKGYATGIDMKWSGEFLEGLESWISLSLMKTEENIDNDHYIKDNEWVELGYIPRPTDQRFAINIFFQDHLPGVPQLRLHLNFIFSSGLPYNAPNMQKYRLFYFENGKEKIRRTTWYRRVDVGFSYMFLEQNRDRMKHKSNFLRTIKNMSIYFEVFNLFNTKNVSSYSWFGVVDGGYRAIPNYLTSRLFNLKFTIDI